MKLIGTSESKLGKKNVLSKEQFVPIIEQTVDEILELLKHSCGRNSRYGLVISPETNQFMDLGSVTVTSNKLNIFSKDGAHLTQSLQYGNALQSYIQNLLVYIGDRVDSACGDGTTTSMIFAGEFLKQMFKNIETCDTWKQCSTIEITQAYDKTVEYIMDQLDDTKITVQTFQEDFKLKEEEAIKALSYYQAYTSSNGDKELAEQISLAFSQIPAECIDEMYQVYPEMERDEKIEVIIDEAQFIVEDPIFVTTELLNTNFMKEYVTDDAILICLPQGIADESALTTELFKTITSMDPEQHIVIIAPKIGNSFINRIIHENTNSGRHIALVVHGKNGGRFSALPLMSLALCGLMNVPIYGITENIKINELMSCVREGIKVHFTGKQVKLYNLYQPLEDYNGHPGLKEAETYPYYSRIRSELHETKDRVVGHHKKHKEELDDINEALAALEYTKRIKIIGGGKTYEQLAIRLVIEDCIAATLSSIKHGMHFNGPHRLSLAIQSGLNKKPHELIKLMLKSMSTAVNTIINCIFADSYMISETLWYQVSPEWNPKYRYQDANQPALEINMLTEPFTFNNSYVPSVQPSKMFEEMFVRIKEVMLKTLMSDHIVTIGEVFDSEVQPDLKQLLKKASESF
jgi:chaperonin GroEL (HSP60 family)